MHYYRHVVWLNNRAAFRLQNVGGAIVLPFFLSAFYDDKFFVLFTSAYTRL